jgi:beta-lactam-binding protein with PASTA domain
MNLCDRYFCRGCPTCEEAIARFEEEEATMGKKPEEEKHTWERWEITFELSAASACHTDVIVDAGYDMTIEKAQALMDELGITPRPKATGFRRLGWA